MTTETGGGAPHQDTAAATRVEGTATTGHGSASAPQLGTRTIAELSTEELDQLVPVLDASVHEALRVSPHDRDLDDLKTVAAACRIERRRRHGRDRLNQAQQILGHLHSAGGDRS